MKKTVSIIVVFALLIFNISYVSVSSAQDMVTEKIPAVSKARQIATDADGSYWEGASAPVLADTEVALPVIDESSGKILGYIVADKAKLVKVLEAAGLTEVASSLAAVEAGTVAGLTAGAAVSFGTIGLVAAGAALVIGVAVAAGGGGGTTTQH